MKPGCSYSELGGSESHFLNCWISGSCFSQLWRNFASWPPLTNILLNVCEPLFVSRIAEPVECQNSVHMFISSESVINFYGLKLMRLCVYECVHAVFMGSKWFSYFSTFCPCWPWRYFFLFGYLSVSRHYVQTYACSLHIKNKLTFEIPYFVRQV